MPKEESFDEKPREEDLVNPWRRGPVTVNPYRQNAFRIARVTREMVQQRTLVQRVTETRNIIRTDAMAHTVGGEPVTHEQLNTAERTLLTPEERILEELLQHRAERPPVSHIRKLLTQLTESSDDQASSSDGVRNHRLFELLMNHLVLRFLDTVESPDPSFGAMELSIDPPFGPPAEP